MKQRTPKIQTPTAKVIIVGGQNVGKTSILQRFVEGTFNETTPTVGKSKFLSQYPFRC